MRKLILVTCIASFISFNVDAQTISGVITKDGAPARGVRVLGSGLRDAVTNRDGRFTFRNVLPGNYEITPYSTRFVDASPRSAFIAFNEISTDDLSFLLTTLPETQTLLRGRLKRLDADAVQTALVDISEVGTRTVDRNGVFTDTSLPEGRYVLTPFAGGYTFSPSYIERRVYAGKAFRPSFNAFKVKPGDTYATFLGGVYNLRGQATSNSCTVPISSLSGSMGVSQSRGKVSVRTSSLGTLRGTANNNGFNLNTSSYRSRCRISSNLTAVFQSRDSGTVSGTLRFTCLLQEPCEATVEGIFSRY